MSVQGPDASVNQFPHIIEYLGSEAIPQRRAGVIKKNIDSANVQTAPIKAAKAHAVAVIGGMRSGAPRKEYYWEKPGSATNRLGINTFFVGEARTSISQIGREG